MWRAFTRESPARRGLAVLSAGVLFVGTVGLAWFMASTRSSFMAVSREQSPANWPVRFTLPKACSWSQDPRMPEPQMDVDGRSGRIRYVGRGLATGESGLVLYFERLPPGTTQAEALEALLPDDVVDLGQLRMGPLTGRKARLVSSGRGAALLAVGCNASGLAVVVQLWSDAGTRQQSQMLESISASIVFLE